MFFSLCLSINAAESSSIRPRVPDGFSIEPLAGSAEVRFPMFAAFDDEGNLFVAESSGLDLYTELSAQTRKCRVRLLRDRDGDGRFETARIFADKLVFPMGLAWRDGRLYVADPPDLVVFEDHDRDGQADQRNVILSGFGHRDNGSLHGLVFGPDGLLYMTMGEPDGYRLKRRDGTVLHGKSGALIRCRPDGSDPEVLCRGFENLVEIVFTPNGAIIGTDNWFQKPSGGLRDALVHLVEGGLYPMYPDTGTAYPVTGDLLPPISLYPAVALSGLALYRGEAFPRATQGSLFSAQHNSRKVVRHVLIAEGESFRVEDHDFVTSDDPDFHPSDVLEAADGSLLVVDTGGWYVQHCPTGKIRNSRAPGGIFRVQFTAAKTVQDPWGLQVQWKGLSSKQLAGLLEDSRFAVRDRAQRLLMSRAEDALEPLAALLDRSDQRAAQEQALWVLSAISHPAVSDRLRSALTNADPNLACIAAQTVALRADRPAAPVLAALLTSGSPAVRLSAAQALARCGGADSLPAIWTALAEARVGRHFEHALIHAAHWIADEAALEKALRHPHSRVQKAALLLLDQPPRRGLAHTPVVQCVASADTELRRTALQILQKHPEWSRHVLGFVQSLLAKPRPSHDEMESLKNLILAFQLLPDVQELVAAALTDPAKESSVERSATLLEALSQTNIPQWPPRWNEALARGLRHSSPALRLQAVRILGQRQISNFDELLLRLGEDEQAASELRLEALRAVSSRHPSLPGGAVEFLLGQLGPGASPLGRLAAGEVLGRTELADPDAKALLAILQGHTLVAPSVVLPALLRAGDNNWNPVLDFLFRSVERGWRPSEPEWNRIQSRVPAPLRSKAEALAAVLHDLKQREGERLAAFEPLLKGGNEDRGRAVFLDSKIGCAACHRVGSQGGVIGPDLTKIGAIRSGRDLIESIVLPSSTFAQGYEAYSVRLKDGQEADGIIVRQSAEALVLRDSSGAERFFRRDDVRELDRRASSIMPEGLEAALSKEEFRDLLAFLQSLK